MKNYLRSICSTCKHAPYCSLTTDMSSISSCSEYVHRLDKDDKPIQRLDLEIINDIAPDTKPVLI